MKCMNCGYFGAIFADGVVTCPKCGFVATVEDEAANATYIRNVLGREPISGGDAPSPQPVVTSGENSLVEELNAQSKAELVELADSQGVDVQASMTKAEIVDALVEALGE